jgi:hypothetical protein
VFEFNNATVTKTSKANAACTKSANFSLYFDRSVDVDPEKSHMPFFVARP